jgi:hypothetical protein
VSDSGWLKLGYIGKLRSSQAAPMPANVASSMIAVTAEMQSALQVRAYSVLRRAEASCVCGGAVVLRRRSRSSIVDQSAVVIAFTPV